VRLRGSSSKTDLPTKGADGAPINALGPREFRNTGRSSEQFLTAFVYFAIQRPEGATMLDDNILRGAAWIFGAVSVMMLLILMAS
jgi:hypothetical protein